MIYTVNKEYENVRLDRYLTEKSGKTRSFIEKIISDGEITVNEKSTKCGYKLKCGDIVEMHIPEIKPLEIESENIPLDIIYEDKELIVVNKPQGMVVHPAPGNYGGTLVNALMHHCGDSLSGINGIARPGILHRIDKDTSGLLLVAKTDKAHVFLAEQIKEHSLSRRYEALVFGNIKEDIGMVDKPLGRNPKDRKKMCIVKNGGKNAVTHYEVLERFGNYTHIGCRLETGRTHQIRVHMQSLGHPVSCDPVYGVKKEKVKHSGGQLLHAKTLGFIHPETKEYMEFSAPLPNYFENILCKLRNESFPDFS